MLIKNKRQIPGGIGNLDQYQFNIYLSVDIL